MADLRFDYTLLQELINTFKGTREGFENLGKTACPSALSSDDPVAAHHAESLPAQEEKLLADAVKAFQNAQNGAQAA